MPVPDGHSLVKNESKKWQKELIPLILNSPSRRLKWWSGNDLHTVWCLFSRGPSSLCFATLRLQCKSQSYPLLLLVICSLDVELKKSPWAGLFPQHSPTHRRIHATHTHTHTPSFTGTSLFLRSRHNSRTHIFDVWAEYILRDVFHPSCLTWFQSGGGTRLSLSRALHVSKDEAWKLCRRTRHILNYTSTDGVEWSCVYFFVKTRAILPLFSSITTMSFLRYTKLAM